MDRRYQVVVVGGGPVGVALAVDLGLRGVSCLLIERSQELHHIPKGQNLTQRTLEHFYFWGIVDELRAARIMPAGVSSSGVTAYKNLMSEYWIAPPGREVVSSYYYQRNDRLPQYQMEKVLRKRMAELSCVEARFGCSARSVEQDDGAVRVTIVDQARQSTEVVEADYVVGCDGGHSIVRESIGVPRGGADFDQLMVLAVFKSRELHNGLKRFPERSTYRVLHPDLNGYWQFFGRVDVGESWFFHSPVPAGTTKDNFDFHALIQSVAGFDFACEFEHVGFWDLRVAVAETYQVGRVFIAGDAAHSHPPYGGYGVNNGLEDVANLGWKLAARLQGWGGNALLQSYGEERHPIFKDTAEDFIAARIAAEGEFLHRYNPDIDRQEFLDAWKGLEAYGGTRVTSYEPNYEGSGIVMGPPGGRSSAHGEHLFKARAGHHLAPQILSSGKNVYEELGPGFTLLAFDAEPQAVAELCKAADRLGIPFRTICDTRGAGREKYEARLVLVRPDQFVAWTGDALPESRDQLMASVTGRN